MMLRKIAKTTLPIIRNASIGAVAGGAVGFHVSNTADAPAAMESGWKSGFATGAMTGLPFGKLARQGQLISRTYATGLKVSNSASKTAKLMRAVDKGYTRGRVIFRRVRGRLIAIKGK